MKKSSFVNLNKSQYLNSLLSKCQPTLYEHSYPNDMFLNHGPEAALKYLVNYYQKETFNSQHGQNYNHWC